MRAALILCFDPRDVAAYVADMRAIFEQYGLPDDCPPHRRAEMNEAMRRCYDAIRACQQTRYLESFVK